MTKSNGKPTPAEAELQAIYAQVMQDLRETVAMMERHIARLNEMIGRVEGAAEAVPKPRKKQAARKRDF